MQQGATNGMTELKVAGDQFDLDALRCQDPAAFERLYHTFAPELQRYLLRLCQDAEAADDLLQQTFHSAFCALLATTPDLALRPWLYAIATNAARSTARLAYWRRVGAYPDHTLAQTVDGTSPPDARIADADLVERILGAMKSDQARLVLLPWWQGFSIDELCTVEGVTHDTLQKRLYRARKAFSAAYAVECARDSHRSTVVREE
jgi:RNA polymerase sigma factor (sigma-70 family)